MQNNNNITNWPSSERPRERLVTAGPEALSDSELLAILLRNGRRGKNAIELAHELLDDFKGLQGIFSADFNRMKQHLGLGPAKFCQLKAALELSRRYLKESLQRKSAFRSSHDAHHFIASSLKNQTQEVFAALFLDNQHRLIQFERLFHGTINRANVHPRELVKRALQHNAAAVIIAHNHPSGSLSASSADKRITEEIKKALALIDIKLLDHIIVADNKTYSFKEHGLL